ncbi:MAG: tRNA 2-selenouridine(34) synthase MnmH [Rhodoferax sp.]
MSLIPLSAQAALTQLDQFDTVIDARSPAEYALDHLPGAVNWPTLDDAQRVEIGTLYKQVNPFEARKRGAAMAARNIAAHVERELIATPKHWNALAYCWRGGQRSGALALVLSQIGFRIHLLEGGYKAFRAAMVQDIAARSSALRFRVVCGPTGSGKTRLLQALAAQGAQVLDLEDLANHRSSVLGAVPGLAQPSQKHFETRIWTRLRRFGGERPVYAECESQKVGNLTVPLPLIHALRASACLTLDLPLSARVALLLKDYAHLTRDPESLCARLDTLVALRGRAVVGAWQARVRLGDHAGVVADLLRDHYDLAYGQSTARHFSQFGQAPVYALPDANDDTMQAMARALVEADTP